ncbi:MAG: cation diffusion facilitator family transporter [Acidimicrobiia bacterium]
MSESRSTQDNRRTASRHRKRLGVMFGVVTVFMLAEAAAGLLTNSLALLSDAGHMATDALGLGMALAAIIAADRAKSGDHRTFGLYRIEILAALANAILLLVVAGYVLYESVARFRNPPDVLTGPMLAVAVVGLGVNLLGFWLLREGSGTSINLEGAFLEVLADLWGSIGVIAAALTMILTGWQYADPLFGAAIGLFILPRAIRLGSKSLRILVQAAPARLDLGEIERDLADIGGVGDVHDLHVWTLTSEMDVASVHLMIREGSDSHLILDEATRLLRDEHGIAHATLQVEPETHAECQEMTW